MPSKWVVKRKDELHHAYSSPYYDPVKAHEYYEKHKKLKGRKKASGPELSEKGQLTAQYVKDRISSEYQRRIQNNTDDLERQIQNNNTQTQSRAQSNVDSLQNSIEAKTNDVKARIQNHTYTMNRRVEYLRTRISKRKKGADNSDLLDEISRLKEQNEQVAMSLTTALSESSNSAREKTSKENTKLQEKNTATNQKLASSVNAENKRLQKESEEVYKKELEKIKKSREFQEKKKK